VPKALSIDALNWLASIDNVTASLIAVAIIVAATYRVWLASYGRQRHATRNLRRLAIGVNEGFVTALFGQPTYGHLGDTGDGTFTWVDDILILHCTFGSHSLCSYSITSRDNTFVIDLGKIQGPPALSGRLGRSSYTDIWPDDSWLKSQCLQRTNRRVMYCEALQAPTARGGLSYMLAYTDASHVGNPGDLSAIDEFSVGLGSFDQPPTEASSSPLLRVLRSSGSPNTVVIARPFQAFDPFWGGKHLADGDVLRLLEIPTRWWHWRTWAGGPRLLVHSVDDWFTPFRVALLAVVILAAVLLGPGLAHLL
jgi:hypothetical protein